MSEENPASSVISDHQRKEKKNGELGTSLRKGADFQHISEKFHISPRVASLIRNRDVIGDDAIENI